jgi:hypothetical protein
MRDFHELTPERRNKRGRGEDIPDRRRTWVTDVEESPRRSVSDQEAGVAGIMEKGIGGFGADRRARKEHRSDVPLSDGSAKGEPVR